MLKGQLPSHLLPGHWIVGRIAVVDRDTGVVAGGDGPVYVPMASPEVSVIGAMVPLAEVKLSDAPTGP